MDEDIEVLKEFLRFPKWTADQVFEKFRSIPGIIYRKDLNNNKKRFLFLEGQKADKVVLVAHADTFFDSSYWSEPVEHNITEIDGVIYSQNETEVLNTAGLGADDRAGCAMLWLLRNSGHSLLITDGEENGMIGSKWLMGKNKGVAKIINSH